MKNKYGMIYIVRMMRIRDTNMVITCTVVMDKDINSQILTNERISEYVCCVD